MVKGSQLREKFFNTITKEDLNAIIGPNTHVIKYHVAKSKSELLQRTLTRESQKAHSSSFKTYDDMKRSVISALNDNTQNIINWIESNNTEDKIIYIETKVKNKDKAIGYGIKDNAKNIRHNVTNDAVVVLRKNQSMPLGFELITAYPNLDGPNKRPTDTDLTPILKETETYRHASPEKKAYLECRVNPSIKWNSKLSDNGREVIAETESRPDMRKSIRISAEKITAHTEYGTAMASLSGKPVTYMKPTDIDITDGKSEQTEIFRREHSDEYKYACNIKERILELRTERIRKRRLPALPPGLQEQEEKAADDYEPGT